MKKITINSFEELSSDKARRRVLGRRRFHTRVVTGVPVRESVEFRIIQKRKEIAAMDAELPKATKQAIAITLFGVTKYYRIEDKEAIIASKFGHTIVEVEENTQVIRFGF
jgi:hypothetical protein